jgi:hypothetical protein
MAFNGDEGSVVTLAEASGWTANYRRTIPAGEIISQFVGRNKLMEILNQDGCMGVRIYYGIGDDGKKNLILVGAEADENDMVDGIIVERLFPCPPLCSGRNSLNS